MFRFMRCGVYARAMVLIGKDTEDNWDKYSELFKKLKRTTHTVWNDKYKTIIEKCLDTAQKLGAHKVKMLSEEDVEINPEIVSTVNNVRFGGVEKGDDVLNAEILLLVACGLVGIGHCD